LDGIPQRKQGFNDPLRVMPRIARNELRNRIDVFK